MGLAAEGAARDAQIAELAKITNTTETQDEDENPIPRIVFQGSTNSQDAEITPSPTYEGATVNGTQVKWQQSATENRWDHTKRYILVETEVSATDNQNYNTMVKSDARVHWYTVIDPIADPAEAPTFTLTNINAVANVTLEKTVLYSDEDPYSQVYIKEGAPTVASLITGERKVVYTLDPDVTGKNQMLESFFLKETGLAALTAEEYGSANVPAVPDYTIEKIVIGQASHKVPATLEVSGAPIFAQVTFYGTYGEDVRPAVQLLNATTAQLTFTANEGTKTFTIEYFSPVISDRTDGRGRRRALPAGRLCIRVGIEG